MGAKCYNIEIKPSLPQVCVVTGLRSPQDTFHFSWSITKSYVCSPKRGSKILVRKVERFCTVKTFQEFEIQKLSSESTLSQVNVQKYLMFANFCLRSSVIIYRPAVPDCIGVVQDLETLHLLFRKLKQLQLQLLLGLVVGFHSDFFLGSCLHMGHDLKIFKLSVLGICCYVLC